MCMPQRLRGATIRVVKIGATFGNLRSEVLGKELARLAYQRRQPVKLADEEGRTVRIRTLGGGGSAGSQVEPFLQSDRVVAGLVAGGEEQRDGLACLPIEQVANRRLCGLP